MSVDSFRSFLRTSAVALVACTLGHASAQAPQAPEKFPRTVMIVGIHDEAPALHARRSNTPTGGVIRRLENPLARRGLSAPPPLRTAPPRHPAESGGQH